MDKPHSLLCNHFIGFLTVTMEIVKRSPSPSVCSVKLDIKKLIKVWYPFYIKSVNKPRMFLFFKLYAQML